MSITEREAIELSPLDEERFWNHVDCTGDCWTWRSTVTRYGYAQFYTSKWYGSETKSLLGHRVSYFLLHGELPEGLDLDHLCRNRRCVNPHHLEAVTRSINVLRGLIPEIKRAYFKSITKCHNGHEFTPENTRLQNNKGYMVRECLACKRARSEASRQQRKEA
jgi:hypothetical protein